MKKRVLSLLLVIIILFSVIYVAAADLNSNPEARACLKNKVKEDCSGAQTSMAAAFSAMALGNNWTYQSSCKGVLLEEEQFMTYDGVDLPCWGPESGGCDLKTTSIALLALNYLGESSSKIENITNWIIKQEKQSTGLNWFLEIDHTGISEDMNCNIRLNEQLAFDATVTVLESKQISGNTGTCFELDETGYFLKIKESCYNNNFSISCNRGFLTTLLYKKKDNTDTFHISSTTNIDSADAETQEKIESICFGTRGTCDYEGSLWAAFALSPAGYFHEHSIRLLPYLITEESSNQEFFPPAFLYPITNNHGNYLDKIKRLPFYKSTPPSYFWLASDTNDRNYDTALGLLSIPPRVSSQEKDNVKLTLIDNQGSDGCFELASPEENAFLLFAGWPIDRVAGEPTEPEDPDYQSCTDDDGGINNRTKGSVLAYFTGNAVPAELEDTCVGSNLTEYSCSATNTSVSTIIKCSFGCDDGACNDEIIGPCVDACNITDTKCSGTKAVKICGDFDDDECNEWGNATTCNYRCSNGKCVNRSTGGIGTDPDYCSDAGFFCGAPAQCPQADTLTKEDYFCGFPGDVCCKSAFEKETCSDLGGTICPSGKECSERTVTASGTANCCKGTCQDAGTTTTETECEEKGGFCKTSCFSSEKEEAYSCDGSRKCCSSSTAEDEGSSLWIIILLIILIILVVLAIIFRNQLKIWLFKMKSKFTKDKGPAPTGRPGGFPPRPGMPPRRMPPRGMPRRHGIRPRQIIPRTGRPMPPRRPAPRPAPSDKGFDDTLKKLKDMTK